jgi:hypothetical protein
VLVRLTIESRKVGFKPTNPIRAAWGKDKPTSISTLNLVDLAGSERSNKAGTTGNSLKEGSYINKSLLTLGTVISNLSEGKEGTHIPYRNSKLTRLLAGALGGNAKTTMITCISPASGNVAESQSTLRFAQRAKKIVNKVKKNDIMDAKTLASKLVTQNDLIEELKAKMQRARDMGFSEEDGGETVKDKAVATTKALRSIKFLMQVTPHLITCLKSKQMFAEAEDVSKDLKLALAGKLDLFQVIKKGQDVVEEYLPNESKLLTNYMDVQEANESGAMFDVSELNVTDAASANKSDDAEGVSDGIDELFALQGSNTNPDELERYQMLCEDLHTSSGNKITRLQASLSEITVRSKEYKTKYEEAQRASDGLKADLATSASAHKSYQEDSNKARMVLKQQVEMLRTNMNNMLVKGGETSQILQEEVRQLHTKMEELDREVAHSKESKKRLDQEIVFLRSELNHRLANESQHMREITTLQNTVAQKNSEAQAAKYEVANLVPQLAQLEKNNAKLRQSILDINAENELTSNSKIDQIADLKRAYSETAAALDIMASKLKQETAGGSRDREVGDKALADLREFMQENERKLEERVREQESTIVQLQESLQEEKLFSEKRIDQLRSQNIQLKSEITTLVGTLRSYDEFVEKEISTVEEASVNSAKLAKVVEDRARERVRRSVLDGEDLYSLENIRSGSSISATSSPSAAAALEAWGASPSEVDEIYGAGGNALGVQRAVRFQHDDSAHQQEKRAKAQRDFLTSPAPVYMLGSDNWRGSAGSTNSKSRKADGEDGSAWDELYDDPRFKTIRTSLAVSNAMLRYSTENMLALQKCASTLNRSNTHQLTNVQNQLEIALGERASLYSAKASLDKSNALCAQRESNDEDFIGVLDDKIAEMREKMSALTLHLTDVQEELKQALAANKLWGIKYSNLRADLEREEKEKKNAQKESKRCLESMELAQEKVYLTESLLGQREQELAVLQVERDELAKHYYKVGSADDDFTYHHLLAEESKFGADPSRVPPRPKSKTRRASIIKLNAKESETI